MVKFRYRASERSGRLGALRSSWGSWSSSGLFGALPSGHTIRPHLPRFLDCLTAQTGSTGHPSCPDRSPRPPTGPQAANRPPARPEGARPFGPKNWKGLNLGSWSGNPIRPHLPRFSDYQAAQTGSTGHPSCPDRPPRPPTGPQAANRPPGRPDRLPRQAPGPRHAPVDKTMLLSTK